MAKTGTKHDFQTIPDRSACGWMKRRHNWEVEGEWIVETPGILVALFAIVQRFTQPGDGVMVLSPVFFPWPQVC